MVVPPLPDARDPALPPDALPMAKACARLTALGLKYYRPTPFQLKIGPVSFWPNTGALHVDGERRSNLKGWDNLLTLLRRNRLLAE